jgi:hypothetical protein
MAEVRAVMPQAHGEGDPWISSTVHDHTEAAERESH